MERCCLFFLVLMASGSICAEMVTEKIMDNVYRLRMSRNGKLPQSLMNRYGIIEKGEPEKVSALPEGLVKPDVRQTGNGFALCFPLTRSERIYGLGDVSRENLNRRGGRYEMWVKNINSYIPIPMVISSRGWGLLVNCTQRHVFDVGKTDPDALSVTADEGEVDFYLFAGRDYRELLDVYTRLTGRPKLLPIFAYGFTYVANQWLDSYEVVQEAYKFRELGFPCDAFGLEPGWMEGFYDSTTKKEWNKRFVIPDWMRQEGVKGRSWQSALQRMGFKLSLWLCMRYDLFVHEEACAEGKSIARSEKRGNENDGDGTFVDARIDSSFTGVEGNQSTELDAIRAAVGNARRMPVGRVDGFTGDRQSGEEPWFGHLEKFVDDGARCFKLDGSWQICEFPKRMWAGKYTDKVAHNVYPIVYAKQMCQGFENHTGRRAMIYSAGGYVGVQRYVATWAGDTGGGVKTLVSTLNLSASGHPNQSCDAEISDLPSLHYGVFSPWMQQNNWDYYQQPWYRSRCQFDAIRDYVKLRYRLMPYIYAAAAEAARTGWPMARPLAFVYPEHDEYANECGTYLFGDSLLVSAFADETVIPPGEWYEWRTGEKVSGPCHMPTTVTETWGGGLYVKAGSIVPMWLSQDHLDRGWGKKVELHVWKGADSAAELYEDDGDTLAFQKGAFARLPLSLSGNTLTIGPRIGAFAGMPGAHDFVVFVHGEGTVKEMEVGRVGATEEKKVVLP